jgi:glutamate---cysteine ligase / carboxylate-amine ligase
VIERRFGESAPYTLGVEEELMLLDAETLAPAPVGAGVLADAADADLPGALKAELFAAVVESNTPIAATAEDALRCLVRMREAVAELAEPHGARVAAFGAHPFSPSTEQEFSADERYRPMIEEVGPTAARQNVCGLHVHVGMPSADACHRALEGVLPWLPVVLAASANSPYLDGVANGLASNRAEALALLPRNGAPPPFASYDAWEAYADGLVAIGLIDDYRRLWWDVRPHPAYGTLEIRVPDQPTSVRRSGAFAALVQALCATAVEAGPSPDGAVRRGHYVENRWRALRFGPRAELIHPDGRGVAPARDLLAELLQLVAPAAERLGGAALLADLHEGGSEADLQLAAGDARRAAQDVVDRSLESPA